MRAEHRGRWASKLGFVLATAGAAIGLGNLWKFPYLMGKNGGFFFLVAYLVFAMLLGLPVMITEMTIGRMTQQNPVNAYRKLDKNSTFIGVIGVVAAFIILSYYSVIGGWLIKYVASYATTLAAPADFTAFIAQPVEPIIWHLIFMALTCFVCYKGTKGIEKVSSILMPGLFVLLVVLIARSVTLPGASAGLRFMLSPADSQFSANSVVAALGQVFYSLSLGMGITITYGSYLSSKEDIPKSCFTVAALDTMAAILAGFAIFPAVFAFGLEPAAGPGLIFGTLPKVFSSFPGGAFFALIFFVLIFFAAITSAIALLECVVSFAIDNLRWHRRRAVLTIGALAFLVGVPSSLSFGPLRELMILNYSFFDFVGMVTDNLLMPLGGIAMCVYVGWIWGPDRILSNIEQNSVVFRLKKAWLWCIRIITPILIIIVTAVGFGGIINVMRG